MIIIVLENHKKPESVQLPYANKTNTTQQIKYSAQNMGTFKKNGPHQGVLHHIPGIYLQFNPQRVNRAAQFHPEEYQLINPWNQQTK